MGRRGVILRAAEARGPPGGRVGPGRRHPPGGGGSRSTGREAGTWEASLSSGRRRLAVHREGGRDRGGVVILWAGEARGPPGGSSRVEPGRRRHPPGGGGSRFTGREGKLAVHREGRWDRGGLVILRAAEARGPPGGRRGSRSTGREGGTGRRRHPQGGGGSRFTGREGGTGEVSSSSGPRRLAVHREGGRGVVILRAAEDRVTPGGRAGPGRRRQPPGSGGSLSNGREGGTGEASSSSGRRRLAEGGTGEASSSSGLRRLAVHREDRGGVVILPAAEARGPPGERAGPVRRRHPPGGGSSRSTGSELEGGTREASSSSGRRRLEVLREGLGRGGSRSTGREGGTGEASSSYGQRRLAVHREGGEAHGPP